MPSYILKFKTPIGDRYLVYSTIVDAPTMCGTTLEDFRAWYREEYGRAGMDELEQRLKRVEWKGSSHPGDRSVADIIRHNHAGKNGTRLTYEQFVDFYVTQSTPDQPTGV